jgi:hypothetical protein
MFKTLVHHTASAASDFRATPAANRFGDVGRGDNQVDGRMAAEAAAKARAPAQHQDPPAGLEAAGAPGTASTPAPGAALGGTLLSFLQARHGNNDMAAVREVFVGLKILPRAAGAAPSSEQIDTYVETVLSCQAPLVFGYVEESGTTVQYFHSAA